MKRLLALSVVLGLLAGVAASHHLWSAAPQANKVLICHASDDEGAHVISISNNGQAVAQHLANHGDCIISSPESATVGDACDLTDAEDDDTCDNN